jgi:hypothetical protein
MRTEAMMSGIDLEVVRPPAVRPVSRPLDMLHLARQSMGDPGLELEILRMFDEIVAVHFARLEQATSVPDLLTHLHTIKAASAGVGAWSLAEHAHIMERELEAGEPVNPERVDDIHVSLTEVRDFVAGQIALGEAAAEAEAE